MPALSVAENIALGDLPVRRLGPLAMVDRRRMRAEARAVLAQLDFEPDPDRPVASLSFAERQLVAIAKALRRRCRIFILDEPTAALEKHEVERLFAVLARMQGQGTAIVYISHRLDEVVAIADRCTVLRDGRVAAVSKRGAFAVDDLVSAMTGRATEEMVAAPVATGEVLLAAEPDGARAVRAARRGGDRPRRAPRQRHRNDAAPPVRRRRADRGCDPPGETPAQEPRRRHRRRHRHGAGRAAARPGDEPVGARQHPAAQSRRALARGLARPPRRRPHRRRADGAARHPAAAAAARRRARSPAAISRR